MFWNELTNIKSRMLKSESSRSDMLALMDELEQFLANNSEITKQYKNQVRITKEFEDVYIMESKPIIDENIEYKSDMSSDEKAKYIAQRMRQVLIDPDKNQRGLEYDLSKDNLRGECRNTTRLLLEECSDINSMFNKYQIKADGFNTKDDLGLTKNDNHSFGIIHIDGKKYIVDCTYRQFFSVTKNIEFGRVRDAGKYMLVDDQRKAFAEQLLKQGFVEATPENLKMYFDGFVLADAKSKENDVTNIKSEDYQQKLDEASFEKSFFDDLDGIDISEFEPDIKKFLARDFNGIEGITEEQKSNLERMKREGVKTIEDLKIICKVESILPKPVKEDAEQEIDIKKEVINNLEGIFDTILYEYTNGTDELSDSERVRLYNERVAKLKSKFGVYASLKQDFKKTEKYEEMLKFLEGIPVLEEYKYDDKVNSFINQEKEKRLMQTNKASIEEYTSKREDKTKVVITPTDIAVADKEAELVPEEIEKSKKIMQLCLGEIEEHTI